MNENEREIDFMSYVMVLWRRKWQIGIPSFLLAAAALVISLMATPVWEVDIVIQLSKFFNQTEQGLYSEVYFVDPNQIVGLINQQGYNQLVAVVSGIPLENIPGFQAQALKDTKLIRVWIHDPDPGKGKKLLLALFDVLRNEFNKKTDVEMKVIGIQILKNNNNIEEKKISINDKETEQKIIRTQIELMRARIEIDKNKKAISEKRVDDIAMDMDQVKKRIDGLSQMVINTMAEVKQGNEALGILLYNQEGQNNIRYFDLLSEKLSIEKVTQENLQLAMKEYGEKIYELNALLVKTENEIKKIHMEIDDISKENELLEGKKSRIDYAQLVKDATQSNKPVSPRKGVNTAIAGIFALGIFSIGALFLEYLKKQKESGE